MAQINVKVKSDFAQASKDLKNFGTLTESEAKRVKKYQDSFKGESVDKFIDKNRRLGAAYKANKGDVSAIIAQQKALERQSISLINKGLDPEDKAIQQLNAEYNRLQKEYDQTTQATKGMENASKMAGKALLGIGVAAAAAGTAIIASTVEIGKMGDDLAKTSKKIGVSTDALQELSFAAERTGLPANNLSGLFQKLNRNMGDLQAGTGTLTTFLNKSDTALKSQLESATDSEQAFNILIDAIAKAPTQFDKAALSQAAFGRAGQDLILFANEGSESINALREEARNYGLVSEDVAKQGEDFVDSQRNLQQALTGIRSELAEKLLPSMTDTLNKVADFISDSEKLEKTLKIVGLALTGVTAGLTTFLVLSKGAAVIQTLSTAFVALNLAMKANPAIFIASAITAVLIPAIILIVKNWDKVSEVMQTSIAVLGQAFKLLGTDIKMSWTVAINALKLAWLSLGSIIVDKVLGGVQKFLDLASKIPFVGDKFAALSDTVGNTKDAFNELADDAKNNTIAVIQGAVNERNAVKETTKENIKNIKLESKERLAALDVLEKANGESTTIITENSDEATTAIEENDKSIASSAGATTEVIEEENEKRKASVMDYVNAASNSLNQLNNLFQQLSKNQISQINKNYDAKVSAIDKATQAELKALGLQDLSVIESLNKQLNAAIDTGDKEKQLELEKEIAKTKILEEANGKKVELDKKRAKETFKIELAQFKANKALSIIQAGIDTASAVIKALPNIPLSILAGVSGAAGIASIVATPAPTAPTFQTGTPMGGFEVPQNTGSSRADNTNIAVSPNENVSVTPRGEAGNSQNIIVQIDRDVIFNVVNDGVESGDIRITADNIQSA